MDNAPITEVMTADPVTVDRSDPISDAYSQLNRARFHHLPVLEGDQPVGLISSTDILDLVYDADGAQEKNLMVFLDHQFNMDDAMSTELVTLPDTATVRDATEVLADGKVHSVLVIGSNGMLEGIVTTTDLMRYMLGQF